MDFSIRASIDSRGIDALTAALNQQSAGGPMRDMFTQWGKRTETYMRRRFDIYSNGGGDWAPLALSTIRGRVGASTSKRPGASLGGGVRTAETPLGRGARSSLARDTARGKIVAYPGGFLKVSPLTRSPRTASILRDTGILMNALTIGAPGSTFEVRPQGILYGVAGSAQHGGAAQIRASAGRAQPKKTKRNSVRDRIVRAAKRGGGMTIGDLAAIHQSGGPYLPARQIVVVPDQETLDAMAGDTARAMDKIARQAGGTAGTV